MIDIEKTLVPKKMAALAKVDNGLLLGDEYGKLHLIQLVEPEPAQSPIVQTAIYGEDQAAVGYADSIDLADPSIEIESVKLVLFGLRGDAGTVQDVQIGFSNHLKKWFRLEVPWPRKAP